MIAIAHTKISRQEALKKLTHIHVSSSGAYFLTVNFFRLFGTRFNKSGQLTRLLAVATRPQPKRIKFSSSVTKQSVMKINARRRVCVCYMRVKLVACFVFIYYTMCVLIKSCVCSLGKHRVKGEYECFMAPHGVGHMEVNFIAKASVSAGLFHSTSPTIHLCATIKCV